MKKVIRSGSIGRSVRCARGVLVGVMWAGVGGVATADAMSPPKAPRDGLVQLLLTEHCSATLITARAAVTSAACLLAEPEGTGEQALQVDFWKAIDPEKRRIRGRVIPFVPGEKSSPERARTGVGDLALVFFDEDMRKPGQPGGELTIPTYRDEHLLVAAPADRLSGYLGSTLSTEVANRVTPAVVYTREDGQRHLASGEQVVDPPVLMLRPFKQARKEQPEDYGQALSSLVEQDLGMKFSEEELADVVLPAPTETRSDGSVGTRQAKPGEWGAGIYALKDDREVLVGLVGKGEQQIRLSNYWPWIVKTLLQHDRDSYDAVTVATRVIGISRGRGRMTAQHTCVQVGEIYIDGDAIDRKNGTMPFFRLMKPSFKKVGDGRWRSVDCESMVDAGRTGSSWQPLGERLPSPTEGSRAIFSWYFHGGTAHGEPVIGGYYGHLNKSTVEHEFFRLKSTKADGRLAGFPMGVSDVYWEYIGKDLPPVREMRLLEWPAKVR